MLIYCDPFQAYAAAGTLKQNYANILLMLLRLRQACDHPLLVKGHQSEYKGDGSIEMAKQLPKEMIINLLAKLEVGEFCSVCSVSNLISLHYVESDLFSLHYVEMIIHVITSIIVVIVWGCVCMYGRTTSMQHMKNCVVRLKHKFVLPISSVILCPWNKIIICIVEGQWMLIK